MSEQATSTPEAPATQATPPASEPPKSFTQEELDRIVSERVTRERGKTADYADLKAKADRLEQIEEAQKSEQQRHSDAAALAQKERDEARAESLRYKAAATHGVASDYFDLLGSGDEETITARAERVGGLLKVVAENEQLKAELEALRQGKPAPINGRPVEALKPGATPENNKTDEDVVYERLFGPQS